MNLVYVPSHYPLNRTDHIHAYPEPEVFCVDMDHNPDYQPAKSLPPHQLHLSPPSTTQYTSSPSLDSQTDDEERLFDVDIDFSHMHSAQQQLVYDNVNSPPWASIATPRAWVGEAHKVPALEPDTHGSPFTFPGSGHQDSNSSMLFPYEYLDNHSPVHSPPSTFLSTPSLAATMLPSSYYTTANSESHAQQSPYTMSSRFNSSIQTSDPGCDPRFVSPASGSPHAGPSSPPTHDTLGVSFADVYTDPSQGIKVEQDQHSMGMGSPNVPPQYTLSMYGSDSGEDEKSESESDPTYFPTSRSRPMSLPSASRMHPRHMRSSSAGSNGTIGLSGDPLHSQRPMRTPVPEPIPNLTKKSRGRRVPTAAVLYGGYGAAATNSSNLGGGKNARTYVCKVKECGKCFARSEHLKRHVRSIHTNEKPHRCPHSGCNKEFSRHDNLCQHMRVHRNYSAPKDGAFESY